MEENIITYCSFYLMGKLFGIDILKIKEINTEINFRAVDHAPKCLKGYVNIRGNLFLIADIATLLGLKETKISEESKIIIFKDSVDEAFGIIVNEIGETITASSKNIFDRRKQLQESNKENERRQNSKNISNGVIKLENKLLITIDPTNIINNLIQLEEL